MTAIRFGTLATPVTVVKTLPDVVIDGRFAWQGPFEHVFAKVTNANKRSIEAVCAWIGREVGLPTPEPLFLRLPRTRMPRTCSWPFGDEAEAVVFGTVALEGALPLTRIDGMTVQGKLLTWSFLELAAVFDELIANDDRTEGNILLSPRGELWLLDHGRALGGGGQRLFSTEVLPLVSNYFLHRIAGLSLSERLKRRSTLLRACSMAQAAASRVPYDGLLVAPEVAQQIDDFLRRRASRLHGAVLASVGISELDGDHPMQGAKQ